MTFNLIHVGLGGWGMAILDRIATSPSNPEANA